MRILVLNSGSSSIRYKLFDMRDERILSEGHIENIGGAGAGGPRARDHDEGLEMAFAAIAADPVFGGDPIDAIGHRVVHGGPDFSRTVIVDDHVCAAIETNSVLAPLHNPPNLKGIRAAQHLKPGVPQVAVFDTAFHQTMPEAASTYPLPPSLSRRHGIRRYGFHGTSCAWALGAVAGYLGRPPATLNLIIAHLGAGASITAVQGGRSVDTSMGLSPLEGVMMQTRAGDIDPAIALILSRDGVDVAEIDRLLNYDSGVKGIAGEADMLTVAKRAEGGDSSARLAREMYVHRACKYIGGYAGLAWPPDALVFTGGVGENDCWIRREISRSLPQLGLLIDDERNERTAEEPVRSIGTGKGIDTLIVKANEELQIAREAMALIGNAGAMKSRS
ncbi:MAG: acetate/propionate family kinase [Bauldia sp.]|nr:acetate/propionate family kinase [Bauldia sp.]